MVKRFMAKLSTCIIIEYFYIWCLVQKIQFTGLDCHHKNSYTKRIFPKWFDLVCFHLNLSNFVLFFFEFQTIFVLAQRSDDKITMQDDEIIFEFTISTGDLKMASYATK